MCKTGKIEFDTKSHALTRAARWVEPGGYFRVYHCPFCHKWHLTSQEKRSADTTRPVPE